MMSHSREERGRGWVRGRVKRDVRMGARLNWVVLGSSGSEVLPAEDAAGAVRRDAPCIAGGGGACSDMISATGTRCALATSS